MEPFTIAADAVSIGIFVILAFFASRAVSAFKQSKQALKESASIISLIVDALTSRVERSESVVSQVQVELDTLKTRSAGMEWEQASLRSSHRQLLDTLQEILTNHKRLIGDIEQLKMKFTPLQKTRPPLEPAVKRAELSGVMGENSILASLTPTERQTVEILRDEGPKAAPDLGKRLKKSREHTSRLMKKLYLEGYVDRESNRAPFRYRLTETVRSAFALSIGPVTATASEKA